MDRPRTTPVVVDGLAAAAAAQERAAESDAEQPEQAQQERRDAGVREAGGLLFVERFLDA